MSAAGKERPTARTPLEDAAAQLADALSGAMSAAGFNGDPEWEDDAKATWWFCRKALWAGMEFYRYDPKVIPRHSSEWGDLLAEQPPFKDSFLDSFLGDLNLLLGRAPRQHDREHDATLGVAAL